MIDYALIDPLIASLPDVTALIASRVYPLVLPDDPTLPAMTYQVIGGPADPTFDTDGLRKYRIQFDCFGTTYVQASQVRVALVKDLNGFTGTIAGTFISNCRFIQPIDRFSSALLKFICTAEFYICTTA